MESCGQFVKYMQARRGPSVQATCDCCLPKGQAGIQVFLSPEIQTLRERGGPGDLPST